MTGTEKKAEAEKKDSAAESDSTLLSDFSIRAVLTRMRGTLTQWVSTFTAVATVIFTGVSLNEFVKSSSSADPGIVRHAMWSMGWAILGSLLIIFASGWASAQRAAPQKGAFNVTDDDPLRFFPERNARDLHAAYVLRVADYRDALKQKDWAKLEDSARWIDAHASRLWQWLEAYRARKAAETFTISTWIMFVGALLVGGGAIHFANDLRQIKTPPPSEMLVQEPREGTIRLLGEAPAASDLTPAANKLRELYNCAARLSSSSDKPFNATILSIKRPDETSKAANPKLSYIASIVPPKEATSDVCKAEVYTLDNTQAIVSIVPATAP